MSVITNNLTINTSKQITNTTASNNSINANDAILSTKYYVNNKIMYISRPTYDFDNNFIFVISSSFSGTNTNIDIYDSSTIIHTYALGDVLKYDETNNYFIKYKLISTTFDKTTLDNLILNGTIDELTLCQCDIESTDDYIIDENYTISNIETDQHKFIKNKIYLYTGTNTFNLIDYFSEILFDYDLYEIGKKYICIKSLQHNTKIIIHKQDGTISHNMILNYIYECVDNAMSHMEFNEIIPYDNMIIILDHLYNMSTLHNPTCIYDIHAKFIYNNNNWINMNEYGNLIELNKLYDYVENNTMSYISAKYTRNLSYSTFGLNYGEPYYNSCNGQYSMVLGNHNNINGSGSLCIGEKNNIIGNGCFINGYNNTIKGNYNNVSGNDNTLIGENSFITGLMNYADKDNMFVCGKFNVYDSNHPELNENKLFVVGNGTNGGASRSDAFCVKSTGQILVNNKDLFLTIYDIIYPVGSYFFYELKITLSNGKPTTTTNTILDYFKWTMINDTYNSVIGLNSSSNNTTGFIGDKTLQPNHLPPHSHKAISGYRDYNGDNNYYPPSNQKGWGQGNVVRWELFLKNSIGTEKNDIYTDLSKSQISFNPYGYYLFCYKRIE